MIKEIVKNAVEAGKEVAETSKRITKSFNPDKRIEVGTEIRGAKRTEAGFNPDKRIKPSIKEVGIEKLIKNYIKDIIQNSEFPETLKNIKIDPSEIKKPSLEEMRDKHIEFSKNKEKLIKEWEAANGKEWPRYEKDVKDKNGNVIRKAGDRYDAHHIHPLNWGGKNIASNITPLRADVHYDHRGVHRIGGAYDQITKKMREV